MCSCGRTRAVWFSVSRDLKVDAQRDLEDLGRETKNLTLHPEGTSSLPSAKESLAAHGVGDGVLFMTYALLIHGAGKGGRKAAQPEGAEVKLDPTTFTPLSQLLRLAAHSHRVSHLRFAGRECSSCKSTWPLSSSRVHVCTSSWSGSRRTVTPSRSSSSTRYARSDTPPYHTHSVCVCERAEQIVGG